MTRHLLEVGLVTLVCLSLPGSGLAQNELPRPLPGTVIPQPIPLPDQSGQETPLIRRPDWEAPRFGPATMPYGPGYGPSGGYGYGPRIGPAWGYPGVGAGAFVGPGWGWPFYSGRSGSTWSNGLSLYGPPVPTAGPIPGVFGNSDLVNQWRAVPSPGLAYGGVGIYVPLSRTRNLPPRPFPNVDSLVVGGRSPDPTKPGGCLILSVKMPQPAAELYVNGVKTLQTGTDRLFNSPVLEVGKDFRYEVTARWLEHGVIVEKRRIVSGTPGEVVRIDFNAP